MAQLSHQEGRTVTIAEIARATATAPNTISSYANNKTERVSLRVLGLIIDYFKAHDMDISMDDLFEIVEKWEGQTDGT